MRLFTLLLLLLTPALAFPVDAHAQGFFKKAVAAAGGVLTTATKVVTAPAEVLVNTGKVVTGSGSTSDIYRPYQEIANSATGTVVSAADAQQVLYANALQFASNAGGEPGAFVFDLGTFSQQYYASLIVSSSQNVNAILQGQNPLQLAAAPLAAAFRAAQNRFSGSARPIPQDVKVALRGYFPESTLNRARYTVGRVEITLPNFINLPFVGPVVSGGSYGDKFAVTVDDIIVFNTEPKSLAWWAHELTHVQQFERLGIDAFAYEYVKDLGFKLEREANQNEKRISDLPQTSGTALSTSSALTVNGQSPASLGSGATGNASGAGLNQNVETYVAQAFFPQDPYPVNYLITNRGRIIAVNPFTGEGIWIGWAAPPLEYGIAWTYQTLALRYFVLPNGGIYTRQLMMRYGQYVWVDVQVGHVVRLL